MSDTPVCPQCQNPACGGVSRPYCTVSSTYHDATDEALEEQRKAQAAISMMLDPEDPRVAEQEEELTALKAGIGAALDKVRAEFTAKFKGFLEADPDDTAAYSYDEGAADAIQAIRAALTQQ